MGGSPYFWPPAPQVPTEGGLPGDYCRDDLRCRNVDKHVTCENNVCVTTNEIGSPCRQSGDCPPNTFCNMDTDVCDNIPEVGGICDNEIPCAYNQRCVAFSDSEYKDFRCVRIGDIDEGLKYVLGGPVKHNPIQQFTEDSETFIGYLCKTFHAIVVDDTNKIYQCRKPAVNQKQGIKNLRKNNAGDECTIDIYNNPEDHTRKEVATTFAQCGFNNDAFSYCPMQLGDDEIMNPLQEAVTNLYSDDTSCHPLSRNLCSTWLSRHNALYGYTIHKALGRENQFPLVANNLECVAIAITASFWMDRFGDSAIVTYPSLVIGVLAVITFAFGD